MRDKTFRRNEWLLMVAVAVGLVLSAAGLEKVHGQAAAPAQGQPPAAGAQGGGGQGGGRGQVPPQTPKEAAAFDLTGYWVSVVTEDWRWRMVTPAKGDYASIPINEAAKKAADLWDPAKDEAAGEQCRSYAAPAIMRVPERVHITWQDDNTLKLETDAGQQTRLFHFGDWKAPANEAATWQGDSVASWEGMPGRGGRGGAGGGGGGGGGGAAAPPGGGGPGGPGGPGGGGGRPRNVDLKVVTTHIRPGYLRKNGVPFSDKAVLTEYYDVFTEDLMAGSHKGEQWFVVTTSLDDPVYLQDQWLTSLNFKREPDGSKWDAEPCSSRW